MSELFHFAIIPQIIKDLRFKTEQIKHLLYHNFVVSNDHGHCVELLVRDLFEEITTLLYHALQVFSRHNFTANAVHNSETTTVI